MSARADVLLWARRVIARQGAAPHQILEIAPGSGPEAAQEAFHRIARMAHPDLHRRTLPPEELELVTTAYARAAAAYQELRGQRSPTLPRPLRDDAPAKTDDAGPAQRMSGKALIHYRKAELALRRGDLTGAVLQLKMAIASDPLSAFLRSALAEVEAGVMKKP
jgi:hypothetical protein